MARKFTIHRRPEVSGYIQPIIADGVVQEGGFFNFYTKAEGSEGEEASLTVVAVVATDIVRNISSENMGSIQKESQEDPF